MSIMRILYRGLLSSCNYACGYCPFAKTTNTRAELDRDRSQLDRFVDWVAAANRPIGIFITPWGEALIHRSYRQAMIRLSLIEHVRRVAIQTNLSGHLDDLRAARAERVAIWATYHPDETELSRFLQRCETLLEMKIRFSVGVVGFPSHFDAISELRRQLPAEVYLWINAPKSSGLQYSDAELEFLRSIDPYFLWNMERWPSAGARCQTGLTSFTVDAAGDARRCHFVGDVLGNIYQDDLFAKLRRAACPNTTCGCHIGYVHRDDFQLDRLYGENQLERIPRNWPEIDLTMIQPPAPLSGGV